MANLGSDGCCYILFTVERDRAVGKWKTSLSVAAMVCGIAAIHYFYMRGVWIETKSSPVVFRYVDWLLTVPLQIVEFLSHLGSNDGRQRGALLATLGGIGCHARFRILGRSRDDGLLGRIRDWYGWMDLHPL